MIPSSSRPQSIRHSRKFIDRHFRQLIIVHNRPATGRLALDDIAGSRLIEFLAIDTMVQMNLGLQGRLDLLGSNGRLGRQDRNKVQRDSCRRGALSRQLLQDLERIGAVSAASAGNARGAQLVILSGIMRRSGLNELVPSCLGWWATDVRIVST